MFLIVVLTMAFLLYDNLFLGVSASPVVAVTVFNDHRFSMMAVGITIMIAVGRPDSNPNTFFRMRGC